MKLLNIIIGEIFRPVFTVKKYGLPNTYKSLRLIEVLKHYGPYRIGVYVNKSGKKFILKYWVGRQKNVDYYMLRHEIDSLKILHRANKRVTQSSKYQFKFPIYISHIETRTSLLVCTSFESGIMLQELTDLQQEHIYDQVVEYLGLISSKLTPSEKKIVGKKNWLVFTYQFPMILSATMIRQHWIIRYLHQLLLAFLNGIYDLKKYSAHVLVHGDLHGENILVKGHQVTILDVGQTTLTYPEYEVLASISSRHYAKSLRNKSIKKLYQTASNSKSNTRRLRLLTVHCSVHNLTSERWSDEVKNHRQLIEFALKM